MKTKAAVAWCAPLFEAACAKAGQPLTLRRHTGYDHGCYFISTFMGEHLAHHAQTRLAA